MSSRSKTAIVTGGLSGMGLAIARRFASDGHRVFVGARRGDDAGYVARTLGADRRLITSAALDVRSTDSVQRFVSDILAVQSTIDILVNAAGEYDEAAIIDHPEDIWDDQIDINLSGTFRMIREVMPHMQRAGWGRIINIASMAAHTGMANNAAYCASKAGLLGLGRCVSLEGAAHGITCVSISPTWVETEMLRKFMEADVAATGQTLEEVRAEYSQSNPQNRLVQPEEIAELAAYLAGDAAQALTMADYPVNAGSPW